MRKYLVLFFFGIASAVLIPDASAQPTTRSLFFTSNRLPPPNGMFLAPAQTSAMSLNGIIISNVVLRGFTQTIPAPPPGTSAALDLGTQVDFDLSSNGGGIFTHVSLPAKTTITFRGLPGSRGQQVYDTEMLQLNITGNLPGGLMVRESAALPSIGQTILQRSPGGYLVSGFFDVFFEVSIDAGQNWKPMNSPQHMELRVDPSDPSGIPPVPEPSPLFPPPDDQLVMPPNSVATFAGGVWIKGLRQTLFSQATDASQISVDSKGMILPYIEVVDFQLSVNGGNTFVPVRASGNVSVALQKLRASPSHVFDTEMLQLDITGNYPGGVVMIRESPTLPSYGGTIIQSIGGGTFEVSSFFDVFLELSMDGGQTWAPVANGPVHLEVQGNSLRDRFASSNLPTPNGQYAVLIGLLRSYQTGGNGVIVNGGTLTDFSSSSPPPAAGQTLNQSFNGQMKMKMSFDGGKTFVDVTANASALMQVRNSSITGNNTAYYDTEMLQLNLTGLPQGAMIRESPTIASTGRLSITPDSGGFRIDSFFDIFTELSMDGGQTWRAAAEGSISVGLIPVPAEAPLRINCPSNITVSATGSGGAVVNFLLLSLIGDCPLLPLGTVTCTPPSGSVFPIGTTTVTCEAHNGCGEHVSCTFQVTVLPTLPQIPDFVFAKGFWPPPGGMFIAPAQFQPLSIGGIIFRNITLRNFLRTVAPPQPGTSRTLDAGLTVELDFSTDGGATFTHSVSPAKILIGLLNIGPGGGPNLEVHDMEIHRFEFSVGNLPNGLRIREAASQPSLGQIGVRQLPLGGGFSVGSFFDVFFELSIDGGNTWLPAVQSTHLELRMDGGTLTQLPEFSPLSPPPDDQFASPAEITATFTGGVRIKKLHNKLFSQAFDATLLGVSPTPVTQQLDSFVYLQWSLDGGGTFTAGRAPATMVMAIKKVREAAIHGFDTEMLQLNIAGGDLPPNIMLRESPTMASHGQMTLEPLADGTFTMSSFFDVFFEASADGGQTWQPSTSGPMHLDLQGDSLRSRFASQNLPPSSGQYQWPVGTMQSFHPGGANIVIRGGVQRNFSESFPPPPPGQGQFENYNSLMDLQISLDGGQTFNRYTAQALTLLQVTRNANINWGDGRYFDTEMLQLNISGGTLPEGMMIRESPTRSSLGRTAILPDGTDGFRLDSFFDVFTELSLDGGRTWDSAIDGPVSSALIPTPPFAPYVITCPSNITVFASSPSGAVVHYTFPPVVFFPDCPFCCFGATSAPPSGALFPIGTTTVTGYGHDGCGENPTCSFTVTVIQPFIYGGLVESILGSAVLNPNRGGPGAPASLIISNLGPSGADGFHVNLGAVDSLVLNFQPFPTTMITDTIFTATGPYGLDPDHLLGIAECSGGTNPMVRADFSSIGALSVLAQVRDENHHLISSATLANNQWLDINSLFPPGCTNLTTVYTYWQGPDYSWWRFCKYGCNCIGTNCYVERIVCLRAVLAPSLRPASISGFDLRARGSNSPSVLTILSTDIGMFGHLHESKGDVNFETDARFLAINNIGSSGEDGVTVNLNNVGKFDMTLAPTRLLAQGACFNLSASGHVNGLPAVQFGNTSLTSPAAGGALNLTGNFSGLGATQVSVEVYQDSAFQGGITLPSGALGTMTITGNLIGCGTLTQPTTGLRMRFDSTFLFTGQGNQKFSGNEIHIRAANPTARARGVSQFGIQACNIGQIAILDEIVTPLISDLSLGLGGGIFLTGQGSQGQTYRLEARPDFGAQTSWKTVNSAEADVDGTFELSDTPNASQQFYRVVTPRD